MGKGSLFFLKLLQKESKRTSNSPSGVSYNHGFSVWKYSFLLYYLPLLFTPILLLLLSGCDMASLQTDDSCLRNLMISLKMLLASEHQLWGGLREITVKLFCLCMEKQNFVLFQRWWKRIGQEKILEKQVSLSNTLLDLCDLAKYVLWLIFWLLQRINLWAIHFKHKAQVCYLLIPVAVAHPLCDWAPEFSRYWHSSQLSYALRHEGLCETNQMDFSRAEQCLQLQGTSYRCLQATPHCINLFYAMQQCSFIYFLCFPVLV